MRPAILQPVAGLQYGTVATTRSSYAIRRPPYGRNVETRRCRRCGIEAEPGGMAREMAPCWHTARTVRTAARFVQNATVLLSFIVIGSRQLVGEVMAGSFV